MEQRAIWRCWPWRLAWCGHKPRKAGSYWTLEEEGDRSFPTHSGGSAVLLIYLHFSPVILTLDYLSPELWEWISSALSHQVCCNLLKSNRQLTQCYTKEWDQLKSLRQRACVVRRCGLHLSLSKVSHRRRWPQRRKGMVQKSTGKWMQHTHSYNAYSHFYFLFAHWAIILKKKRFWDLTTFGEPTAVSPGSAELSAGRNFHVCKNLMLCIVSLLV